MIREILTEWRPTVHTKPLNWPKKQNWQSRFDGQTDNAVHARVVRVEKDDAEKLDEIGNPVKHSNLGIEHKVVSEPDSAVFLIKQNDVEAYKWARRRFAYQFEELEGKTLGKSATTTPLLGSGIVPEGVVPMFLQQGVTSVQSLAYMSDQSARKFGPNINHYRQRAMDYLNNQQPEPPMIDDSDLDARIQKAIKASHKAVGEMPETAPRPRGRPKKEAEAA